ncbi:hypothetical protein EP1X_01435 [Thermococcus sp. EP1]|uniref:glycosyltransferase family 2 protein n=1 Tax=Thermococcus sp. EP1 TaxID=1591054 RepID=UPI0006DB5230|nr:glycosyltransferase [Thermococcus sp. EP1]KPU63882.1 hypothetical protein EP1X_01435 [Thermococcus sp. EP1]
MVQELTVGVVACNRYRKLKQCLYSLRRNLKSIKSQVIVLNGCVDKKVEKLSKSISDDILVITPERRIGPSAARKLIAENTETEYLLFLDDDIIIRKNSVETLLEHLYKNPEVSIVSGAWNEYGKFRELGQIFIFGKKNGQKYVFKKFITVSEASGLGLTSISVHGVMSSMLVRTEIFKKINFDERYKFFYELFDFFMQAYYKELEVRALPNVVFDHRPEKYIGPTMRKLHDPEEDRKRFIEKWGVVPIGNLGLPIYRSLRYQICRRLGI